MSVNDLLRSPMDMLNVGFGLANLFTAIVCIINIGASHAEGPFKLAKRFMMVWIFSYSLLELDFLTRGVYHTTSWVPILWNLLDMSAMLFFTRIVRLGSDNMRMAARRLGEVHATAVTMANVACELKQVTGDLKRMMADDLSDTVVDHEPN